MALFSEGHSLPLSTPIGRASRPTRAIVMSKTWGTKPRVALWLYKMVLLPRLTYAAVIWWLRMERMEAKKLLKSLQG